jgi:YceI-like domain
LRLREGLATSLDQPPAERKVTVSQLVRDLLQEAVVQRDAVAFLVARALAHRVAARRWPRSAVNSPTDMASLESGSARRDKHLSSAAYFDVANHPTAHFRSTAIASTAPAEPSQATSPSKGSPTRRRSTWCIWVPAATGGTAAAGPAARPAGRPDDGLNDRPQPSVMVYCPPLELTITW